MLTAVLLSVSVCACTMPTASLPTAGLPTESPTASLPAASPTPDVVTDVDVFRVSQKKYDYEGNNVMILTVENMSDKAYDVTIKASFNDADGNSLKTMTQTYKGFCSNWTNYAIFQPEIKFDSFIFELETKEYAGVEYLRCVKTFGDGFDLSVPAKKGPGRELYRFHNLEKSRLDDASSIQMTRVMWVDSDVKLDFFAQMAIFDENGALYHIVLEKLCTFNGWGTHDKTLWGNEASDPFASDIHDLDGDWSVTINVKPDIEKLINGYAINSYKYAVQHTND